MRQRIRVKHGYGKEYFFFAKHLHKAAVGNGTDVSGQTDIQGAFGQCLFEGWQAGFCNFNDDSRILFAE